MDPIGRLIFEASKRARGQRVRLLASLAKLDHLGEVQWEATEGNPGCYTMAAFTFPGWWRVDVDVPTGGTPQVQWSVIDLGQPGEQSWKRWLAPILAHLNRRVRTGRRYVTTLPGTSWRTHRCFRFVVYVNGRCIGHVEPRSGMRRAVLAAFKLGGLAALDGDTFTTRRK